MEDLHIQAQGLTLEEVQDVTKKIEVLLVQLEAKWDAENQAAGTTSWFSINKTRLISGTVYILDSIDQLINFVEDLIPQGKDKKAAVLEIAGKLFDYIVVESFPVILKPYVPVIKKIILDVLFSSMIDFIVKKYRDGSWSLDNKVVTDVPETK
jgi:hypothetical protein